MTDTTETQFNDILGTMWSAGIKVNGMAFDMDIGAYNHIVSVLSSGFLTEEGFKYESDFGAVTLRKK